MEKIILFMLDRLGLGKFAYVNKPQDVVDKFKQVFDIDSVMVLKTDASNQFFIINLKINGKSLNIEYTLDGTHVSKIELTNLS